MPLLLMLIIFIFFVIIVFGLGSLVYLSAKGVGKLADGAALASSLPRSVKKSLREAHYYGRLIKRTLRQCPPGPLQDRFQRMLGPVDEWLDNLIKLERGLQKSYSQRNLPREIRHTEFEIDKLRRQLWTADKAESLALKELLESKEQYLTPLRELRIFQSRAELKIRKISTDLGATHAEMMLLLAKGDFNENRLNRLDEDLREQVSGMRDMLRAMEEMGYSRSSGLNY